LFPSFEAANVHANGGRKARDKMPTGTDPNTTPIKEEARRLVKELPEDATWSDFVRLVIERQRGEESPTWMPASHGPVMRSGTNSAFQSEGCLVEPGAAISRRYP